MSTDDPEIVVGTTAAPFKATSAEVTQWLECANSMALRAMSAGFKKVHFFAALEVDSRGRAPYQDLLARMAEVEKSHERIVCNQWFFAIDDGSKKIDPVNRLIRICTGRNLVQEYALRQKNMTHILFLDSDLKVSADSIPMLLEMEHPIVGGSVPSYCLAGPTIDRYPFPVERHWNTAGFLMVERDVARKVRWRSDVHDSGASDDPCYNQDAKDFGFGNTLVRKDLIGVHKPLVPLTKRGHELEIQR
jgi:hypothetical protein